MSKNFENGAFTLKKLSKIRCEIIVTNPLRNKNPFLFRSGFFEAADLASWGAEPKFSF
jgi:hypothetical protein